MIFKLNSTQLGIDIPDKDIRAVRMVTHRKQLYFEERMIVARTTLVKEFENDLETLIAPLKDLSQKIFYKKNLLS
jgi:hypothetical protein